MTTPPNAPDNSKSKLGAVLLVDDTGNSWRYDMDFSELFATL